MPGLGLRADCWVCEREHKFKGSRECDIFFDQNPYKLSRVTSGNKCGIQHSDLCPCFSLEQLRRESSLQLSPRHCCDSRIFSWRIGRYTSCPCWNVPLWPSREEGASSKLSLHLKCRSLNLRSHLSRHWKKRVSPSRAYIRPVPSSLYAFAFFENGHLEESQRP